MKKIPVGILFSLFIWTLTACGSNASDSQHINEGNDYLAKGELQAALIELKNALRNNPENSEARLLLGKVYFAAGDMPTAEKELRRAEALGVEDDLVFPVLGKALLGQGKFDEIQALSVDKLSKDSLAEVLSVKGLAKLLQNQLDEAASLIDQAIEKNPESNYILVAKARLLVQQGSLELARERLDSVFQKDPGYALAWSLLGDLEQKAGEPVLAEQAYTKAIDQKSNSLMDLLQRAKVRLLLKDYDRAQRDTERILKKVPNSPDANYVHALASLAKKDLKQAQAALELAYRDKERYPYALYLLSVTNFYLGNLQQAETYAKNFVAQNPDFAPARYLLAYIKLSDRKYTEVERIVRPILESGDDVVALNLLANALMRQGKTDEGIEVLSKIAAMQPESPVAQMQLGAGLLMAGEQDRALEHMESAVELDPQFQQADMLLIMSYLGQQQFEKAYAAAEAFRKNNPDKAIPYNMLGRVHLARNEKAEAEKAYLRAREIAPGDPSACHALAALALDAKDFDKARSYYGEVLEHNENYLPTLLNMAALYSLQEKEGLMAEYLQRAMDEHPKAVRPRLLLARYYLKKGEPERVPVLFLELEDAQKKDPAILETLALAQLENKKYSDAEYALQQLIEIRPDSAQLHYLISRAHAGMNKRAPMQAELEKTLEFDPNYFRARLALARLFIYDGDRAAAKEHLKVLKELAPEHPDVLDVELSLAQLDPDQEKSAKAMEDIYATSPSTSSMVMSARQKWLAGDQAGALARQEQWVADHPDDIQARIVLANTYTLGSRIDAAMEQYRFVLKKDPNNLVALNNLAWFLRDTNPRQALDYAERMNELKPDSENLMDTYAVVLLKAGKLEEAQRVMRRLLLRVPRDPTVRYHSAMIDAAAGNSNKAKRTISELLQEGREFPEKAEAEKLLQKIQAGD